MKSAMCECDTDASSRVSLPTGLTRHKQLCVTRRSFVRSGIGALAAPVAAAIAGPVAGPLLTGCLESPTDPDPGEPGAARLTARPGIPSETPTLGLSALGLGGSSDGLMYVPLGYSDDQAYPLFIALHGAGGDADNWNGSYPDRAEDRAMIFVAPDSRGYSWDLMTPPGQTFGPDVAFIDEMLSYVFARCRIDPNRIALGGFSDGASYALSLGIGNGDLFSHLVAFSPGFYAIPDPVVGKPHVFVAHGTYDPILPFYNTADTIVPTLEASGYDVTFQEFDGEHEVPFKVSTLALDWFLE